MEVIETRNARYLIQYQWFSHRNPKDKVLLNQVDAFVTETGGVKTDADVVNKRMEAAKPYLGNRHPTVIVIPLGPTKEHMDRRKATVRTGVRLREAGAAAAAAMATSKMLSALARRAEQAEARGSKPKRIGRLVLAVKTRLKKTKVGSRVSQALERRRARLEAMTPGRRKFLKGLAAGGAAAAVLGPVGAAELWDPELLRFVGATGTAEQISFRNRDFQISGVNAGLAKRLDEVVAPRIAQMSGLKRKPVIAIDLGAQHNAIGRYLTDRPFRERVWRQFKESGDTQFLIERDPKTGQAIYFGANRVVDYFPFEPGKGYVRKSWLVEPLVEESPSAMREAGRNFGRGWNSRLAMAKRNRVLAKVKPKKPGWFRRK